MSEPAIMYYTVKLVRSDTPGEFSGKVVLIISPALPEDESQRVKNHGRARLIRRSRDSELNSLDAYSIGEFSSTTGERVRGDSFEEHPQKAIDIDGIIMDNWTSGGVNLIRPSVKLPSTTCVPGTTTLKYTRPSEANGCTIFTFKPNPGLDFKKSELYHISIVVGTRTNPTPGNGSLLGIFLSREFGVDGDPLTFAPVEPRKTYKITYDLLSAPRPQVPATTHDSEDADDDYAWKVLRSCAFM